MSSLVKSTPELDAAVQLALLSEWATDVLYDTRSVAHEHLQGAGFWVEALIPPEIREDASHEARWCGLRVHDPVYGADFRVMVDLSLRIDSVLGEDCRVVLLAQAEPGKVAFALHRVAEFTVRWPEMALAPSLLPVRLDQALRNAIGDKPGKRLHQGCRLFAQTLSEALAA